MCSRWQVALAAISVALAGSACSSSSTTENHNTSCPTKYSATINGLSWCAVSSLANYYPNQQQVVITGVGFAGNSTTASWDFTLSVSGITAAGTYSLNTVTPLRYALAGDAASNGYSTLQPGATGTITFTTFTTSHVVGTFAFTAPHQTGSTGTATVTNGSFDVTVTPGS